jgi:hypothetical protein
MCEKESAFFRGFFALDFLDVTITRAGVVAWQVARAKEFFTADGTLIEAWASMKRFVPKDGGGKPPEDGGGRIWAWISRARQGQKAQE